MNVCSYIVTKNIRNVKYFTNSLPIPGIIKTSQNVYFTKILIIESANLIDITVMVACFNSAAGSSGDRFFSRKSLKSQKML